MVSYMKNDEKVGCWNTTTSRRRSLRTFSLFVDAGVNRQALPVNRDTSKKMPPHSDRGWHWDGGVLDEQRIRLV
jgi:hypothetical protein